MKRWQTQANLLVPHPMKRKSNIVLDEPLANVDPETAYQIADLITTIQDRTLFVISHVHKQSWLDSFDHRIVVGEA